DIKAKSLGVPIYELLGGKLRDSLPVYWSHCGMYRARHTELFEKVIGRPAVRGLDDIERLGQEVRERGFRALKTNLLVFEPGRPATVGRGSGAFELNIEPHIIQRIV